MKIISIISLLIFNTYAFATDIEKDFIRRFHLIKKENYFLPSQKTNPIISKTNFLKELAKIYIIKNESLTDKGLLLFYIQSKDTCHACSVELWLFNTNKKPSVAQLVREAGNSGEPPKLLEVIIKNQNIYFLFKSTFLGQGIAESSLELIQYNLETPKAIRVYFSFLSDTSFADHNPICTGWSTKYEISNERISFEKNGFRCNTNFELSKSRNSTKIQKNESYEFEK